MVAPISLIAPTESSVADCMPAICVLISSVVRGLRRERFDLARHDRKAASGFAGARRLRRLRIALVEIIDDDQTI